jgi:hypothetical protein
MENETKRTLQKILEVMQEQQDAIHALQLKASPGSRKSVDVLSDRLERIATEVSERQSFEIDWARLCDRHYAAKS